MRRVALGLVIGYLLCLAVSATAIGRAHWIRRHHHEPRVHWLQRAEQHYRYVAGAGRGRPRHAHARALRWAERELRRINPLAALGLPPHVTAWLCIHRGEGSWTDAGAPYYGGLQMDWSFQEAYAPRLLAEKGTADHWTPLEQMWVAERAYRSGRGFWPWPNTARNCGLL